MGCWGRVGFPGGEGFLVGGGVGTGPARLSGQAAPAGWAMMVAVEVFGAGVAAGESAEVVAGFDSVADVVGDAVFDGCTMAASWPVTGSVTSRRQRASGLVHQVAGDLRADRSGGVWIRGPVVVPDQRIGC